MKPLKQAPIGILAGAALCAGVVFCACSANKIAFGGDGGAGGSSATAGAGTSGGTTGVAGSHSGGGGQPAGAGGGEAVSGTAGSDGGGASNGGAGNGGASSGGASSGGANNGGASNGGASAGSSGSGGAGGAAAVPCNSVTQQGSAVTPTLASAPPVAAHGTIVPGTYTLTSDQFYKVAPVGAAFLASTIVISVSGTIAKIQSVDDTQGTVSNSTLTVDTSTATTICEYTCIYPAQDPSLDPYQTIPLNTPVAADYTATPTTFKIIYGTPANNMDVATYTKK